MAGTTWPPLIPKTKARASEVEAKFEWLQGDLVPMVGGTRYDNTYDFGTATHRWKNGHFAGTVFVNSGSQTNPSFAFMNQSGTGMFFPTTTTIGIAVAGSLVAAFGPAGAISFPLLPAFSAIRKTPQTITTSGMIAFTTELADTGSNYTTSGVFVAPAAGKYLFNFGVSAGDLPSDASFRLRIGDTTTSDAIAYSVKTGTDYVSFTYVASLTSGQSVSVYGYGTSMTVCKGSMTSQFSGFQVS